jgi:hypothetical protein
MVFRVFLAFFVVALFCFRHFAAAPHRQYYCASAAVERVPGAFISAQLFMIYTKFEILLL